MLAIEAQIGAGFGSPLFVGAQNLGGAKPFT
jgi:hypothetical protein